MAHIDGLYLLEKVFVEICWTFLLKCFYENENGTLDFAYHVKLRVERIHKMQNAISLVENILITLKKNSKILLMIFTEDAIRKLENKETLWNKVIICISLHFFKTFLFNPTSNPFLLGSHLLLY